MIVEEEAQTECVTVKNMKEFGVWKQFAFFKGHVMQYIFSLRSAYDACVGSHQEKVQSVTLYRGVHRVLTDDYRVLTDGMSV